MAGLTRTKCFLIVVMGVFTPRWYPQMLMLTFLVHSNGIMHVITWLVFPCCSKDECSIWSKYSFPAWTSWQISASPTACGKDLSQGCFSTQVTDDFFVMKLNMWITYIALKRSFNYNYSYELSKKNGTLMSYWNS